MSTSDSAAQVFGSRNSAADSPQTAARTMIRSGLRRTAVLPAKIHSQPAATPAQLE